MGGFGRAMTGVASPEQKQVLQNFIADDLAELKEVLRHHQRLQDDEEGAKMRSFYREKYKGRYMQPSYTGGFAYSMSPPASANSSMVDGSSPAQSPMRTPGGTRRSNNNAPHSPSSAASPTRTTWNAAEARSPGFGGSSYTYEYGKDQHQSRGPPYHINNSTTVFQK